MDGDDFVVMANEAISDLNEVAYIVSTPKIYRGDDIKYDDEVFEITLAEIRELAIKDGKVSENSLDITLPFLYDIGHNLLEFSFTRTDKNILTTEPKFLMNEVDRGNSSSDVIKIIAPQT